MATNLYALIALVAYVGSVASSNCDGGNCKAEVPQDETSLIQTKVEATRPLSAKEEIEDEVEKGKRELRQYAEGLKESMPIADERTDAEPPQHSSNFDDAPAAQQITQKSGCTVTAWGGGQAICNGHRMQVNSHNSVLGQSCGKLLTLPAGPGNGNYNFYESTSWVPAMVDGARSDASKNNFAYVPATRCSIGTGPHQADDPSCGKAAGCKVSTCLQTMDLFKLYPMKTAEQSSHAVSSMVTAIPNFKAFGSKVTQDGKYLFICDLDHSNIIALDTSTMSGGQNNKGLVAVFNNVGSPNDIAIWEKTSTKSIVVFAAAGGMNTNVYSATLGTEGSSGALKGKMVWTMTSGATAQDCAATAVQGQGCDFTKLHDYKQLWNKVHATPAGIGVTVSKGDAAPDVWIATLQYFVVLKHCEVNTAPTSSFWSLTDPSWAGDYHCTLPQAYSNSKGYGLIDNVVMADAKTMITAIYTDCGSDATVCLATDYGTGTMFSTTGVTYNAVAFTRVCLDQVTGPMLTSKNIAAASKTFIYPLPSDQKGDNKFNGRITHIQNVGNDLMAINYQYNKVMVFPGVMPHIKC